MQISQQRIRFTQRFRPLCVQHSGVGQEHAISLPDVLQVHSKSVVLLNRGAVQRLHQFSDVWHLKAHIPDFDLGKIIHAKAGLYIIQIPIISGENQQAALTVACVQRHAQHLISGPVGPRLYRSEITAVDLHHIKGQQTAGIGNECAVAGVVISLRINEKPIRSLRVKDEQAMAGIGIALDRILALCDEIIVSQQRTAELLETFFSSNPLILFMSVRRQVPSGCQQTMPCRG